MPSGTASGVMYLVDAHSLIFQVFHAIPRHDQPVRPADQRRCSASRRDLLFLRRRKPDYLVCAFDRPEPTFRSELYADYKAHREPMPDDLHAADPAHPAQCSRRMRIPVVSHPRYEADDVLATLARAAAARGLDVYLCTSDKDCRQLIDDRVRLYNLRKHQEFGRAELLADWGVTPEQVVDLQTLVGDSVDNVPGVPGIGVKTAAKLLQEFGTLENLLANVDKVSGAKRQENLRSLVADHRPEPPAGAPGRRRAADPGLGRLAAARHRRRRSCWTCSSEWGFRSFAAEVRETTPASRPAQPSLAADGEELFPFGANAATVPSSTRTRTAPPVDAEPLADGGNGADRGRAPGRRLSPGRYAREVRGVFLAN